MAQAAESSGHSVSFEGEVTKEKLTQQLVATTWRKDEAEELFAELQSKYAGGKDGSAGASTLASLPV